MRLQSNRFRRNAGLRHGLIHIVLVGVQPIQGQARHGSVECIANNGTADGRQLRADLMFPPRHEPNCGLIMLDSFRGHIIVSISLGININGFAPNDFQNTAIPKIAGFAAGFRGRETDELTGGTARFSAGRLGCPHPMQVHAEWYGVGGDGQVDLAQFAIALEIGKDLLSVAVFGEYDAAANASVDAVTEERSGNFASENIEKGSHVILHATRTTFVVVGRVWLRG